MQRIITFCILLGIAHVASAEEIDLSAIRAAKRAPHPTQLTVKYKDQRYPVVRMKNMSPYIMIDGREKQLKFERDYLPIRTVAYGPESVELTGVKYGGMQQLTVDTHGEALGGSHPGIGEFQSTVKSQRTLKGGFITLVIYTPIMFLGPDYYDLYGIYVIARELPDLPAGQEVPVNFTTQMPAIFPHQRYFVHIFDEKGREAKTNIMQNGWSYYSLTEKKLLKEAVVRYKDRFEGKDNAVTPIVMMNPLLPENTPPPTDPVIATFTVSADGLTKDVTLKNALNDALDQAVRDAIEGWLFLPRLVNGEPVETLVEVPIKF